MNEDKTERPDVAEAVLEVADAIREEGNPAEIKRANTVKVIADHRDSKLQKQFWFLFALMFVAFLLLAYRSETNASDIRDGNHAIEQGLYDTCVSTAERSTAYNPGRIALAGLLVKLVNDSALLPADKASAADVLNQGLVLKPANCGEAP